MYVHFFSLKEHRLKNTKNENVKTTTKDREQRKKKKTRAVEILFRWKATQWMEKEKNMNITIRQILFQKHKPNWSSFCRLCVCFFSFSSFNDRI